MAVALNDLAGDWFDTQAHLLADELLDMWRHRCMRSHRARNLAHRDLLQRVGEALLMALQLVHPEGQFEAKGDWLGMNAMRTSGLQRIFVFAGRLTNHAHQLCQPHSK